MTLHLNLHFRLYKHHGQAEFGKNFTSLLTAPEVVMKTSPNPFVDNTILEYQLKTAAQINIGVFDAQGKQIKMLVNKRMPQGNFRETFNGKSLDAGIYFIKLSKDGEVKQTLKIVKG